MSKIILKNCFKNYFKNSLKIVLKIISKNCFKENVFSDYSIKLHSKMEISDDGEYYNSLFDTVKESGILPKMRHFIAHCKTTEYAVIDEEMVQNFIVETRKDAVF